MNSLMTFLRSKGLVAVERKAARIPSPVEQEAETFGQYLRHERALADATVAYYIPFARRFLAHRFGRGPVALSLLSAADVVRFVSREASRLHLKRAKMMTTALRSFLNYLRYRGETTLDLARAVPTVASWSMTSIPRAIPPDSVRKLLASIRRDTIMGHRDYAIVLLLARLGLRASEVVCLELEDIDWTHGCITVQGKGRQRAMLPVPYDVGAAIAAYLRRGRPQSASRRVFLRCRAPFRGFVGPAAIASLIGHRLVRLGIEAPTRGAHQFRHALATRMLGEGASLAEIGEVLRHRSVETTKIYAKVDFKALRALAMPWPGGVR